MAGSSLSILSSSAFPSNSQSSSSKLYYHKDFRPDPRYSPPISRGFKLKVTSRLPDASPDQFLQNNSIADFMRFKSGTAGELQTAVVSYRKRFPWSLLQPFVQVDLVSTIHIADKEYFDTIQKELEPYDSVLYEMVASRESLESTQDPSASARLKSMTKSRGFSIIGFIQRQMANFLMLDFQLDCLDYQAQNWYHADLDFETFELLQCEKGESLFTFARDMTLKALEESTEESIPEELGPWRSKLIWASRVLPMPLVGLVLIGTLCSDVGTQSSDFPELEALSRLDFGAAMKFFLAKRLTSDFTSVTAEDVEEESVIIGERNRAATEVLRMAIEKGHNKIAILYGGGHMPDLGRRLREEFDLVPSNVRWITAWTIDRNKNITSSSSSPFLKTIAEVLGWPLNRYQTLALLIFSFILAVDLLIWELIFDTMVNWVSQVASEGFQILESGKFLT